MRKLLQNKWFKFGFWGLLYLLWVIWLGNYWWLFGLPVIFDIFITRKVKWAFWKKNYKEGEKHNVWLDWLDAIIFAVIVVIPLNVFILQAFRIPSSSMESTLMTGDYLFVGKLAYGPKLPERPLSIPFVHNTIFGKKSYSDLIKKDYRRLAGFTHVKRGDIVVFNFPHGDTVLSKLPMDDYYTLVRFNGREYTERMYGPLIIRPVDKEDNYVKRCVAVAGDTLRVVNGTVIVNGDTLDVYPGIQNTYTVITTGSAINPRILEKAGVETSGAWFDAQLPGYRDLPMTEEAAVKVAEVANVVECRRNVDVYPPDYPDSYLMLFPFTEDFKWTRDNYGPLYIPAKGDTVTLTLENLPLYRRIIDVYEGHDLEVIDGVITIDGEPASQYTFAMDYYFMMGDNRHNSLDSRYWGFVPESHIVGKPRVVWFSKDVNKPFPRNIRWNRLLKFV
ncbi:MAG TPA: signal peptidase I [Candidatus Coprenecus stercoravium]|uniref:Signal peptidase I n=1 Tax=Candidatus Coprenecus stercoravium TaxID=2840735 RepID=A0A9D2GQL8_9BACT|nr:signal peptidase I [Candidatus Coprenecus stercoravium]